MTFLSSLLPTQGFICVAEQKDVGFRHHWADTPERAQRIIDLLEGANRTVFVAQASFLTTDNRKGVNAQFVKNYFLDIDVAADGSKDFITQKEALTALFAFCKAANLPAPSVVSSGFGLYAHWRLDRQLPALMWKQGAELLKKLTVHYEFKVDQSRTADLASVLRPVGSFNKKRGERREVKVIYEAPIQGAVEFTRRLKAAAESAKIHLAVPKKDVVSNSSFLAGLEGDTRPSSAFKVQQKCAQVAAFASVKGNVPEPLWYAMIAVLNHCQEGSDLIHEWSSGHPDYSEEATDAKIQQHLNSNTGPATCARLHTVNPGVCDGCRFTGKITSPVQLGKDTPEAAKVFDVGIPGEGRPDDGLVDRTDEGRVTVPEPPEHHTISEQGVFFNDEPSPIQIYPYPLWVTNVNSDYFGESFTIKHRLPHEGWREVTLASNKICEPKSFFSALIDAHIAVVGKEKKGLFMVYIETFMAKLRADQRLSTLSGQMGWIEADGGLAFVHGAEIYTKGGETRKVGYSASAPEFVKTMKPTGEVTQWVENTKLLNKKGLEGLAFEFLCGAFGSPLVKFTGFEGAMLSVVGDSGLGKTLVGKWGLSAWGDPKKLMLTRDDTKNALVGRFGVYNSLPAYIDEISNIPADELSDLAYKITQGRDKARLTRNATERKAVNGWNLLAIVSSNHSLMDKLAVHKGHATAEFNRIFEFEVEDGFSREEGARIAICEDNYGEVGKQYAQYLVEHQDEHKLKISEIANLLDKRSGAMPDERFWTMTAAVAIYGGLLAKKLGLSHVDVNAMIPWMIDTIKEMRKYKNSESFDAISFFGSLLDKYNSSVLCVNSYNPLEKTMQLGYREPKSRLVARIELDRMQLWMSYDVIKNELSKLHVSPRKLAATLHGKGLEEQGVKISLGRGTIHSSISQNCWRFDLKNPALGHKVMALLQGGVEEPVKKGVK